MTREDQDRKPTTCNCRYLEITDEFGNTYHVHDRGCASLNNTALNDPDSMELEWEAER